MAKSKGQETIVKQIKDKRKAKFVKLIETLGVAMRHTNVNHHSKSEEAWTEFAERLWDYVEGKD